MAKQVSNVVTISPAIFKWIFQTVLTLTVLSLLISVGLSFFSTPSTLQTSLFETCTTTWKLGFGAIVGMIGGKAANSD